MLIRSNTYLTHEIFGPAYFYKRNFFIKATKNVTLPIACLDTYEHIRLGLRYKKLSSQVIDKMGSNVIFQQNLQEPPSPSYELAMEALSSLITRQKRGDKSNIGGRYGKLDRMSMYIKILGLEEHLAGLKIIHVAGTKGKGSTCVFCEAILRECGFRTGLFTSPHLVDVRERFRIDGFDISEDKFLQHFWNCWNLLKNKTTDDLPMPPLFQFLTVLAFKIFICEKVDVAIIEVGLGGKKDSTNVINEPVVCGITSLGMDHMETLGNTLGQIALHKAGIMKPEVPAFTVPQLSEAMDALRWRASEVMVPLEVAAPLDPKKFDGLKLGLSGDHQLINAGLAVALCRSWLHRTGNLKELFSNENKEAALPEAFLRGLSTAHLSGRAQIVYDISEKANKKLEMKEGATEDLVFYLDGAHSPESMEACARWFSSVVAESENHSSKEGEMVDSWRNGGFRGERENFRRSTKMSKQILLFNCMDVRDPHILLPRLVNTCDSSGVHFSKALFVPSMSTYNKVTSGTSFIKSDTSTKDLSWQFTLQRIWEKIIHGKDSTVDEIPRRLSPETLPSSAFLYEDPSQKSYPPHFDSSAVIPSLPLTIKWLRDCVKENPSVRVQVLVTGSLHLVGDVLKLLRR